MTESTELSCQSCGGTSFTHFFGLDRRRRRRWQNRCNACGHTSEYVPSPDEIESQCRVLRQQWPVPAVSDEHEKLWRLARAKEEPEGSDDDDSSEGGFDQDSLA